jgi:calcium-binding protein CML
MGAKNSRPSGSSYSGRDAKKSFAPPTRVEQLVAEAVQGAKRVKDEKGEPLAHFTKILMRAPKLNNVFFSVKAVFNSFDKTRTGSMSVGELQEALSRLTMQDVTEEETREFFHEVDVYEDGRISFKEFIVCLALGYVLNTMPALRGESAASGAGGKSAGGDKPKPRNPRIMKLQKEGRRPSFLMGEGPKIAEAFSLVMDAYLTFDSEGKGFITRDDMRDFITTMGSQSPSKSGVKSTRGAAEMGPGTSFLTEERMDEMDWDGSGHVTYSEFVYSFLGWVGFEEDDEDEDAGASAGGKSGGRRK